MLELSTGAVKRLSRELRELAERPCEGIRILVNEQDIGDVQAELEGPTGGGSAQRVGVARMGLSRESPMH
jgi:ubiquitin-conjugating enzyme E2 S